MSLRSDVVYALRQMRRAPLFSLATVATLALGIGATTAIFTLMNAVMLKSLPVADPARLYRIGTSLECCYNGWEDNDWSLFSHLLFQRLKENAPEFEQLTAFQAAPSVFSVRRVRTENVARPLNGEFVDGNYFSTFGVKAYIGRTLQPEDDQASAAPVAVLSYHTWQQNYGSDPSVIGSVFTIDGQSFTIAGISPPGFFGDTVRDDPPDLWAPLQQEPLITGQNSHLRLPNSHWLYAIGRVRPGANLRSLPSRLTAVLRRYLRTEDGLPPDLLAGVSADIPHKYITISYAGGGVQALRADYEKSLRLLMIVCALVLIIACANVANLLLARAQVRRSQISLRVALGASRKRLVKQALTESILLSLLGGAAGMYVAYGGAALILSLAFPHAKFLPIDPSPSWPVLAFAFGVSIATGILFGTAPAWFVSKSDPVDALRTANRSTRDTTSSPQRMLVITQAALSIVLLSGAGLLARSLANLQHQNFGVRIDRLVSIRFNGPSPNHTGPQLDSFYRQIEDGLSQIPNVQSASLALYSPLSGNNWSEVVCFQGRPAPKVGDQSEASWDRVSAGYFNTVGQHVVRGRDFLASDTRSSQPVAIVSEAFVKKFFKQENPLGKHFGMDLASYSSAFEIVGVVEDAKYTNPDKAARPMFFLPLEQWFNYREREMQVFETASHFVGSIQLRLRGEGQSIEPQVRKTLASIDPNLTIIRFEPMRQQMASNFDQERTVAQLSGLLALLALVLAAVGLYGVTAYAVAVRTNEIGIRMALGAKPLDIVRSVLRGAFLQIVAGLALGVPIAIGAGRLLSSELYGVRSYDPPVLAAAILALACCAFIASLIPAQRAAAVDPVQAMRSE